MSKSLRYHSEKILSIVLGVMITATIVAAVTAINGLLLLNGKIGEETSELLLYTSGFTGILFGNLSMQRKRKSNDKFMPLLTAVAHILLIIGTGVLFVEEKTMMNWGYIAAVGVGVLLSYVFQVKNGARKKYAKIHSR